MTDAIPSLRYISTPAPYMGLLRTNMQKTEKIYNHLKAYIERHDDLQGLILKGMRDIDENQRLDKIISSLGWLGVRDRLACQYLHYNKHRHFPVQTVLEEIDDILNFEKKLHSYTAEGYSRGFMLAFYLRLLDDQLNQYMDESDIFSISDDCFELLKLARIKTLPIDWMILVMEHFISFFGKDELHRMLLDGVDYNEFYQKLSSDEKVLFNKNLIIYAASIGETDIFMTEKTE